LLEALLHCSLLASHQKIDFCAASRNGCWDVFMFLMLRTFLVAGQNTKYKTGQKTGFVFCILSIIFSKNLIRWPVAGWEMKIKIENLIESEISKSQIF
jgi:hypothetical protein